MIRRHATLIAEKQINVVPLDAMHEPFSRQQFINSPGRLAAGQSHTKPFGLAMKCIFVVDKPFSRGYRKLFRSIENKNIGRDFHNRRQRSEIRSQTSARAEVVVAEL